MQIKRRKATEKECREWFAFLAALFVGGLLLAILHLNGRQVCLLKRYTGYPCLFCGGTRAAFALSQGHWREALSVQPLLALVMAAAAAAAVFVSGLLLFRGELLVLHLTGSEKKFGALLALLLAFLNWIYLLRH